MAMKMCLYFICNFRILFSTSADTFIQRNLQGIPTWVIEHQVGVRASCSSPYHLVCVCLKDNRYVGLTLTSEQFEPFPPEVSQRALCSQNGRLGVPDETGTSLECRVPSGLCAARQVEIPAETTSSSCVCGVVHGDNQWEGPPSGCSLAERKDKR